YSLGTGFVVWSSWALLRALQPAPQRGAFWVVYGVLAVAFCYTHHLALFVVAAQFIFVVAYLSFGLPKSSPREPDPVEEALSAQAVAPRAPSPAPWKTHAKWASAVGLALAIAYLPWLSKLKGQSDQVRRHSWQQPLSW